MSGKIEKCERNQSIELLRIILMVLIVLHHIILHGGINGCDADGTPNIYSYIHPLMMFHVDAFVFISGYYGITLKWKKLIVLIAKMFIYSLIAICITIVLSEDKFTWGLLHNIYPISTCDWWFMAQYIYLMLMSPLLNAGMERLNRNQSLFLVLIMYIASFRTYYCLLIFIYLLARHLKSYPIKVIEDKSLLLFCMTLVIYSLFNIVCMKMNIFPGKMYDYIFPFNVMAAVFIFYTFLKLHISCKWIGFISSGVLASYLITDHELLRPVFTHGIAGMFANSLAMLIISSITVVVICSLIDKLFSKAINLIVNRYNFYD